MNGFYKAYCRTFQRVMGLGNYFLPWRQPELLMGQGAVRQLPALIKSKGIDKVLVVTDKVLLDLGMLSGMLEAMKAAGLEKAVFDGVMPNPTIENVEAAYKLYKENGCQAIVAFGGGSSMDCSKACGARVGNPNKSVMQMKGLLRVWGKPPMLFAVPTTAGTGSEATVTAVITDAANHHKITMNDTKMIPHYAVLDPELTVGLPKGMTATTGLDALSHAVEAFTNLYYNTAETKAKAISAVRLINDNLLMAYEDGSNLEARKNMLLASHYGGIAFTRGCVGYVHSTGHTLGGLYGLPHGMAMSIILPHVMKKFGPAVYERLAILADAIGLSGDTDEEKAKAFIRWNEELKVKLGIPEKTDAIKTEDIPQIIKWSLAEANPLYPVPVLWDADDLRELIDEISAGPSGMATAIAGGMAR